MDDKWLGWTGLIIAFVIFQVVRAVLRGSIRTGSGRAGSGMARLNAAAERILKARGGSVANPVPRTNPAQRGNPTPRTKQAPAMPRNATPLPKSTTPAVIRRSSTLMGAREPVIQRRR